MLSLPHFQVCPSCGSIIAMLLRQRSRDRWHEEDDWGTDQHSAREEEEDHLLGHPRPSDEVVLRKETTMKTTETSYRHRWSSSHDAMEGDAGTEGAEQAEAQRAVSGPRPDGAVEESVLHDSSSLEPLIGEEDDNKDQEEEKEEEEVAEEEAAAVAVKEKPNQRADEGAPLQQAEALALDAQAAAQENRRARKAVAVVVHLLIVLLVQSLAIRYVPSTTLPSSLRGTTHAYSMLQRP